jgi:hypothetical protein
MTRHLLGFVAWAGLLIGLGQLPAAAQQPKAIDQAKKANEGARARDHVFDGRRAPPNPVRANPGPKPSPVGTPVREFKPQVRVAPSKPPPPPPRNLNPTGDKAVQDGIDRYRKPGSK